MHSVSCVAFLHLCSLHNDKLLNLHITFCMLQDIKFAVHAHPTLSEVLDELFKAAKVHGPICPYSIYIYDSV
jgi:hypothetical protein